MNKALEKTLFHFFSGGLVCRQKKMKVCFVRWLKFLRGGFFLIKLFSAVAFKVMSGRVISCQKS